MQNGSENVDSDANHVLRKKVSSYMISHIDIRLHKYVSIIQKYWKIPILLNNRGIFREWDIDMGDHITTYFLRIT